MSNLIKLSDLRGWDPILRKGDLVRLTNIEFDPEEVDWDLDLVEQCEGYCGIVLEIQQRYGEDSEAPRQACSFSVGFPFEDGWATIEHIPIAAIRRVLTKEKFMEAQIGNE